MHIISDHDNLILAPYIKKSDIYVNEILLYKKTFVMIVFVKTKFINIKILYLDFKNQSSFFKLF